MDVVVCRRHPLEKSCELRAACQRVSVPDDRSIGAVEALEGAALGVKCVVVGLDEFFSTFSVVLQERPVDEEQGN